MSKRKSFLADQFAVLSNPTPEFEDPEEDDIYTRAQLDEQYDEDDETEVIVQSSSLRRKNASLLVSTDKKYSGKTVSRKDLQHDSDESVDDTDESINGESFPASFDLEFTENDDITRTVENKNTLNSKAAQQKALHMFTEELDDKKDDEIDSDEDEVDSNEDEVDSDEDEVDSDGDEDDSDGDEDDSEDEESEVDSGDEEEGEEHSGEEEGEMLKPFSNQDINEEIEKGRAAKAQLGLWDSFMELRIKLQKALSTTNQIPQYNTFPQIKAVGSKDLHEAQNKAKRELKSLLDTLLDLQELLLVRNPETKHVIQGGKTLPTADDDDEEIPSDDEDISSDDEDMQTSKENDKEDASSEKKDASIVLPSKRVKRKLQDYEEIVAKRHKNFHEFRNMTLQKWHDKTKIASGKISSKSFSSFDRSVLKQIDQILVDQDRLVKRTQLKRTMYTVVGKKEDKEETINQQESNDDVPVQQNQHLKDYDPEIFDDDDFYHQLLRELIEKRTAGTTDPNQLTRQWLEVQKLRSKVRKKVDTKASKGRKIRYEIHQKLVSFMAPDETSSMTDESRTELNKSLFGQRLGKTDTSHDLGKR